MSSSTRPIIIASRGSALALAQANFILSECRKHFPKLSFDLKIIKTTGDKLQKASMARIDTTLPRGLFTKELEEALLKNEADLAVHSLKDLPTQLPEGLKLGATTKRADVRDVFIYRSSDLKDQNVKWRVSDLPQGATVATSSTRRSAQLLALRSDLKIVPIRGNVGTRLQKLADQKELHGIILAAAGLERLGFRVDAKGVLSGEQIPAGLKVTFLEPEEMLPCVGQAALGIQIRENDERLEAVCQQLNELNTWHCVVAERAFLRAMGGGCQSAVAAYAQVSGDQIKVRAVSFLQATVQRGELKGSVSDANRLGEQLAEKLKG